MSDICGHLFEQRPWFRQRSHCGLPDGHEGRHQVSTRRKARSGLVHEMADLGVRTACGQNLAEPWEWTDEPTSCVQCIDREESNV